MKNIVFALVTMFAMVSAAEEINLDALRGNTLDQDKMVAKPDTYSKIQKTVAQDAKVKCNDDGCELYVYDCIGREFKVSAGAGRGQNLNGGSGSGINIFNDNNSGNDTYYGINFTYINSKYKHTVRIPESMYSTINTYLEYMKTKEYLEATMKQRPETVSKDLELILSLAATLRGGQCTNTNTSIK